MIGPLTTGRQIPLATVIAIFRRNLLGSVMPLQNKQNTEYST